MGTRKGTEVVGGIVETPENENKLIMPPEQAGRKDIGAGEIVIATHPMVLAMAKIIEDAKRKGQSEIIVSATKGTNKKVDEGR